MKTPLIGLLAAAALIITSFTSCEKDKQQVLDANAKISIKPSTQKATTTTQKAETQYLDPVEIVRQTTDIAMQSKLYPNEKYVNYMIADMQKDLTAPKIMMWGMWIIDNGALTPDFIEAAYDVVIVTRQNQDKTKPISDTLAYIPNATLRAAEGKIKAAFEAKNYDEVYRLFDEAYKFIPINGKDWLELKARGEN